MITSKIRSNHTSPGIYTRFTDINYPRIRSRVDRLKSTLNNGGSGGKDKPVGPTDWVFGMKLPIIFS